MDAARRFLSQAEKAFPYDPDRVYLARATRWAATAPWQVGALYPDLFAGDRPERPDGQSLLTPMPARDGRSIRIRCSRFWTGRTPSVTRSGTSPSYQAEGIPMPLHGTADDNVPIAEARHMIEGHPSRFSTTTCSTSSRWSRALVEHRQGARRRLRRLGADVRLLRAPCDPTCRQRSRYRLLDPQPASPRAPCDG